MRSGDIQRGATICSNRPPHPFGAAGRHHHLRRCALALYADPAGEPNSLPDAQAMRRTFLTSSRPV